MSEHGNKVIGTSEKMGIGVINLWDDEEMSQVSETDYAFPRENLPVCLLKCSLNFRVLSRF